MVSFLSNAFSIINQTLLGRPPEVLANPETPVLEQPQTDELSQEEPPETQLQCEIDNQCASLPEHPMEPVQAVQEPEDTPEQSPAPVSPPRYEFHFGEQELVPFPEVRELKNPLWKSQRQQLERTHRGHNLEIFDNGIPMKALRDRFGKKDADQNGSLNLGEAVKSKLLSLQNRNDLARLAYEHGLSPQKTLDPKADAVALWKQLQQQGVEMPQSLNDALSDLEVVNHYLAQTEVSPDTIVFQADPTYKQVEAQNVTLAEYAHSKFEQDPTVKAANRQQKTEYLNLEAEIKRLESKAKKAPEPEKSRLLTELNTKKIQLAEMGARVVEGAFMDGGTVVDHYLAGQLSPEDKARQVLDIYARDYQHHNEGCAATTDLIHTMMLGREINVQNILAQLDDPKLYDPDANQVLTPGDRNTPFTFAPERQNGRRVPNENLLRLFDPQNGSIKPGMVLFINSDPNMRLEGESAEMGAKKFGSSDRHWFTYLGQKNGEHVFIDTVGQKRTLNEMIQNFVQHTDNPNSPMVLHTAFDFYPEPEQRAEFERFAGVILGN